MRKQKRFETRNEILNAIQKRKDQLLQLLKDAETLDAEADQIIKDNYASKLWEVPIKREDARKKRRTAFGIDEVKLPELSRTLAAFDTVPLAGVVPDEAVVLQK